MARTKKSSVKKSPIRVFGLGGLNEIGKNMTVIESDDDIVVVDCGLGFPDDEMLGIDLVIPDVTYLEEHSDKLRGIVLTHGHEDHIGALPYVLKRISCPVYGTRLTLGIVENKLMEHKFELQPKLLCVEPGDTVKLGGFTAEFIHVNHSIADACAIAITTPQGVLLHSGDFKLDLTPIDGDVMDITRIGELGRDGIRLLMCESTNVERGGFTPSEKNVGRSLEDIFAKNTDKRIVIATFSSNVHRVQQIIDVSAEHKRKVAITGRSMMNIISAAIRLGYMSVPDGVLIDINEIRRYKPENITVVTTGSQGEPMSALYRMAFSSHDKVELGAKDLVVISAHAIPGNEKLVGKIINEMCKKNVTVLYDSMVEVHVSGHACREELKLMHALSKPEFFMPVHGEYKHLIRHKELAEEMGMSADHIFVSPDIGHVLEIDEKGAKWSGTVFAGQILIDGYGVGDVGNIVLRDRRHLAEDGLIVMVATVDSRDGYIISGPDIISRGFVYVREAEALMDQVRNLARNVLNECLDSNNFDWSDVKNQVKDTLTRYISGKTGRKPMILPVIMDI
ncbi:MAG: ribonuclease J [Clostridia bacterium]|nr:ribonuclease J [Clostridia bacterium]